MRLRYLSPVFVTLFGLLLSANAQEASSFAKTRGKLVTRSYPVADLIVLPGAAAMDFMIHLPPPGATCAAKDVCKLPCPPEACSAQAKPCEKPATCEDRLIKLIQNTLAPNSWSEVGGPGTIDYYPLGMALIVNQTPDVQEQIAVLLHGLRRLQDVSVAVDVRLISVPERFLERAGLDLRMDHCERIGIEFGASGQSPVVQGPGTMPVAFLNDKQVMQFLEAIQGDPRTNVCTTPKLTMLNGQMASIRTNVTCWVPQGTVPSRCGDFYLPNPRVETTCTPFTLNLRPTVSADRRQVRMHMQAAMGEMNLEKTAAVPDGGTVVLGGWKRPRDLAATSILGGRVPFLNGLFRSSKGEMETVVMLVTPRVILQEQEEPRVIAAPRMAPVPTPARVMAAPAPAPHGGPYDPRVKHASWNMETQTPPPPSGSVDKTSFKAKQVVKLMEMYHEACAGGHHDEARKLAAFALELDPTCFSKSRR